jgi:hypothetical protein
MAGNLNLSYLGNCNVEERFKQWMREGGTLKGNKNLGCGINSLTFLGVFSREAGGNLVDVVNSRGTTFEEMINYVYRNNNNPQFEYSYPITTAGEVQLFINDILKRLHMNSCTVAKMMRYPDNTSLRNAPLCNGTRLTSGHSIVFSNDRGVLKAIDPQQETIRPSMDAAKAFQAWNRNCYKQISLMFSTQRREAYPIQIDNDIIMEDANNIPLEELPMHDEVMEEEFDESDSMEEEFDEPTSMEVERGGKRLGGKYKTIKRKKYIKRKKSRKTNSKKNKKTKRRKYKRNKHVVKK